MRRPVAPSKPRAEMTEEERQMDELSKLPIHVDVPGMKDDYEEEEEPTEDSLAPKSDGEGVEAEIAKDPVLTGAEVKDELWISF